MYIKALKTAIPYQSNLTIIIIIITIYLFSPRGLEEENIKGKRYEEIIKHHDSTPNPK